MTETLATDLLPFARADCNSAGLGAVSAGVKLIPDFANFDQAEADTEAMAGEEADGWGPTEDWRRRSWRASDGRVIHEDFSIRRVTPTGTQEEFAATLVHGTDGYPLTTENAAQCSVCLEYCTAEHIIPCRATGRGVCPACCLGAQAGCSEDDLSSFCFACRAPRALVWMWRVLTGGATQAGEE